MSKKKKGKKKKIVMDWNTSNIFKSFMSLILTYTHTSWKKLEEG